MKRKKFLMSCFTMTAGIFLFASYPGQALVPPAELPKTTGQAQTASGVTTISAAEIPFDYAAMSEDVVIQLTEEPRLQSPIRTPVTAKPQTYNLFFREPMDRASVEQALKEQSRKKQTESEQPQAEPQFTANWISDRQLQLIAAIPQQPERLGWKEYMISVSGSKTKSGKKLEQTPEFIAVVYKPEEIWRLSTDPSNFFVEKVAR